MERIVSTEELFEIETDKGIGGFVGSTVVEPRELVVIIEEGGRNFGATLRIFQAE
jgi:hypothetical protein